MSGNTNATLTFATSSSWKYRQGAAYLGSFSIPLKQADIELPESRNEDVVVIAKEKAAYALSLIHI